MLCWRCVAVNRIIIVTLVIWFILINMFYKMS